MWITNINKNQVEQGFHVDPGPNSMLIRVMEPGSMYAFPKKTFKEEHHFFFLDTEQDLPWAISEDEAKKIVRLLEKALENKMNVIVHCTDGESISGSIVDVAKEIGFEDLGKERCSNQKVKKLMQEVIYGTTQSR